MLRCAGVFLLWLQEHSDVPDSNVGRFVFNDLAVANEASSSSIAGIRQLGEACTTLEVPCTAAEL